MGWTVRYNHLGPVAVEMKHRINKEVDDLAEAMAMILKGILWVDTGMIRQVTTDKRGGINHAEVDIGYNRGHGFYSRFQEWGTVKQAARPIVGPTAHAMEPQFVHEMTQAIREACEAQ